MPKFSVYTPTHDPRWLRDCLASLLAQTATDWEWVVVKNGKPFDLPADVQGHPKVRVLDSLQTNIGALKGFAAKACTGQFLVELDHDDRLAPDCLAEIGFAAEKYPGGFYYSDFASVYPNGAPETYGSAYGWEQYTADVGGQEMLCQRAFKATPRSLCEIWYAPNHVRAWSREAYDKAGGYDAKLEVGDDHDLLCRTYLARVPFVHIQRPLYVYRRVVEPRADNTYVKKQGLIQQTNYRTMNRYIHPLVEEWCRRGGRPMLDLGGAHNSPPGYIPVDLTLPHTDMRTVPSRHGGANFPATTWPAQIGGEVVEVLTRLPESSVGCVRAFDFIEHLPREKMVEFMNEAHRVLAAGGFLLSGTPSTDGRGAFQDPTHTNFINQNSFLYYVDREYAKYLNGAVTCRFQAVRLWTECPSDWHKQNNVPYVYADLLALKGFNHIGPIQI